MILLTLLSAVIFAQLCDCQVVQNFSVPQTISNGDNYFVNCTYNLPAGHWLYELSFTKDNQMFYRYDNVTSLMSINGILASSVDVLSFGRLRVRNANSSSAGFYSCSLHARNSTVWSNTSVGARVTFVSGTTGIIFNDMPSTVRLNDTYWVNCTYMLASNNYLNLFTLSKDNSVFYTFNNQTIITPVTGVNNLTIFGNALIRVNNANRDSAGNYTCLLSYRNEQSVVTNISHTNSVAFDFGSTNITNFSTPTSIRLNDTYWVNCTYSLASNNYLNAFTLSKNNSVFYTFNNNTFITPVTGLNNITIFGNALIRVNNANRDSAGNYTCLLWYRNEQSVVTNISHTNSVTFDFGTTNITNFSTPTSIHLNDTYRITCTYTLASNNYLNALILSKDNRVFYSYNNHTNVTTIPGLNYFTVEGIGLIAVSYATADSAGNYTCVLLYSNDQSVVANINYTNNVRFDNSSTNITLFSTPSTVRLNEPYWVNCTYTLASNNYLNVFRLSKDNRVFYSYNNTATITPIPGVTNFTVYDNALILVNSATLDSQGNYMCLLEYRDDSQSIIGLASTRYIRYVNSVGIIYSPKVSIIIMLIMVIKNVC